MPSAKFLQQRLGPLQVRRAKPFGEPAVDRREKITRFIASQLFAPELGQTDRCLQFEQFCALPPRYREGQMITPLGGAWIRGIVESIGP